MLYTTSSPTQTRRRPKLRASSRVPALSVRGVSPDPRWPVTRLRDRWRAQTAHIKCQNAIRLYLACDVQKKFRPFSDFDPTEPVPFYAYVVIWVERGSFDRNYRNATEKNVFIVNTVRWFIAVVLTGWVSLYKIVTGVKKCTCGCSAVDTCFWENRVSFENARWKNTSTRMICLGTQFKNVKRCPGTFRAVSECQQCRYCWYWVWKPVASDAQHYSNYSKLYFYIIINAE